MATDTRDEMTPARMEAFLAEPRIAVLGTNRLDGAAALNPVWFLFDDGRFLLSVPRPTAYGRTILRDPGDQHLRPGRTAAVPRGDRPGNRRNRGRGPAGSAVRPPPAVRHYGEEQGGAYADATSESPSMLVTIHPKSLAT